jgi:hypothetical protein
MAIPVFASIPVPFSTGQIHYGIPPMRGMVVPGGHFNTPLVFGVKTQITKNFD